MLKFSNSQMGILNLLILVLSIPVLGGGIWLSQFSSTDCDKFLERPIITLGVFLMLVSLVGLVGVCCRQSCLLWVYLLVMFVLIVLLFCFTIFAFVLTNKGVGQVVSGRGYKEYKLGHYSNWLQNRVNNNKNWRNIRSCLQVGKVCKSLQDNNQTCSRFITTNL